MSRKVRAAFFPTSVLRKNSLNVLALLIAVPVLAYSLSVNTPREYAKSATSMLAGAASVSAAVPENPYNTLAVQLATKQAQLDQREADLAAQASAKGPSFSEMLGASSFFLSLILLILVALNFYYDVKRGKLSTIPRKFQVDLR